MNGLFLKATKNTPLVLLDPSTDCFVVIGNSLPENAAEFYEPILHWLDRNGTNIPKGATFRFRMNYFSTSSMKALFKMLAKLKEINMTHAAAIRVHWHVEENDEFMTESGSSLFELIDLPFAYIEENEQQALADTLALMQRYAAQLAA